MDIGNLIGIAEQGHLVALLITAPLGALLALAKFKHGSLRLSQSKTKRFYALVGSKEKWRAASSAALQIAVKDAIGIELPGDVIRFSLERDSPLTVLKAFKDTRGLIKLKADGSELEDTRNGRGLTYRRKFGYFVGAALCAYFSMILMGVFLKDHVPLGIIVLVMLAAIIVMQGLLSRSLKYIMADRLLRIDEVYPVPMRQVGQPSKARNVSELRKQARVSGAEAGSVSNGL